MVSHLISFCLIQLRYFTAYPAHRHLHSFPTRRSSDLGPASRGRSSPSSRRTTSREGFPAWRGTRSSSLCRRQSWRPNAATDRKSTRLNSSHLGISYAVFCLKKKKKKTKDPNHQDEQRN